MPSGGYRPGAGRPRKNPGLKKLEGKNKKTQPKNNIKKKPPKKKIDSDIMTDYFAMALKECGEELPDVDALRGEIEAFIEGYNCEGYIAPQTITDYVLNRQGFLACEAMNRKKGRLGSDGKLSPYVIAGQGYYKAMKDDFNLILQIINRHSDDQNEEKNAFLEMLTKRGF